jgi:hypothetical protein
MNQKTAGWRFLSAVDWGLFLFGIFFHADDFFPLVVTTFRAHGVGKAHLTTVAALNQILGSQCVL